MEAVYNYSSVYDSSFSVGVNTQDIFRVTLRGNHPIIFRMCKQSVAGQAL